MYRISILLVSIILATIVLSLGLSASSAIFPFFAKSYVLSNIIFVSLVFLMFFETFFLYCRLISEMSNSNTKSPMLLISIVKNLTESIYFIFLLLPFVALCKVFLAFEFSEILSPLFVFAFVIIIIRMNVLFLTLINARFESFMRILLLLTFLLPVFGFCLWEFSGLSTVWLAYISPAWFQMEVLRSPTIPIYPFFIIWIVQTLSMFILSRIRLKHLVCKGRMQS